MLHRSLLIASALASLTTLMAGCSGGPEPSPANVVTPPPPPDEVLPIALTGLCPAEDSLAVGTNSHLRASFGSDVDATSVGGTNFQITCDEQSVAGIVNTIGANVFFRPSMPLSNGVTCDASIHDGKAIDGTPLENRTWSFVVSDRETKLWRFAAPATAFTAEGVVQIHDVGSWDGLLFVLFSRASTAYLGVSSDGGDSFSTAQTEQVLNGLGTVEDGSLAYADGRIHLAWRVLPVNTTESEIFYSHSTSSVTTLTSPRLISVLGDGPAALDPHVSVGPDGSVQVAWAEHCYEACDAGLRGIYVTKFIDAGDTYVGTDQITNDDSADPAMTWLGTQPLLSLIKVTSTDPSYTNALVDYASNSTIGERSVFGQGIFSRSLLNIGSSAVLHWMEGNSGDHGYYIAKYDGTTLSEAQELLYTSIDSYRYDCSRIAATAEGNMIWLTALAPNQAPGASWNPVSVQRTLRRSSDIGETFDSETELSFLLPYRTSGGTSDPVCPFIAGAAEDSVHVVWTRVTDDSAYQSTIMSARGALVPTCSF